VSSKVQIGNFNRAKKGRESPVRIALRRPFADNGPDQGFDV
jgi:hypothetical protein